MYRSRAYPVWFSSELIKKIKRVFKKFKSCYSETTNLQYNNLRKEIKLHVTGEFKIYLENCENNILSDCKQLWYFIQQMRGNLGLLNIMKTDNQELADPKQNVDAFADFFRSVFSPPSNPNSKFHSKIVNSHITLNEIYIIYKI